MFVTRLYLCVSSFNPFPHLPPSSAALQTQQLSESIIPQRPSPPGTGRCRCRCRPRARARARGSARRRTRTRTRTSGGRARTRQVGCYCLSLFGHCVSQKDRCRSVFDVGSQKLLLERNRKINFRRELIDIALYYLKQKKDTIDFPRFRKYCSLSEF